MNILWKLFHRLTFERGVCCKLKRWAFGPGYGFDCTLSGSWRSELVILPAPGLLLHKMRPQIEETFQSAAPLYILSPYLSDADFTLRRHRADLRRSLAHHRR